MQTNRMFWIVIQDLYILNWWVLFINENLRSWKVEDLLRVTALYLVGDGIQLTVCSLWKYRNSHSVYTSSSHKYRLVKHKINCRITIHLNEKAKFVWRTWWTNVESVTFYNTDKFITLHLFPGYLLILIMLFSEFDSSICLCTWVVKS